MQQVRMETGVLFQAGALRLHDSGGKYSSALPEIHRPVRKTIDLIVRMKLDLVSLSGYENYLPAEISGGMQKRAGLARAMAMDPTILFFDEPSAGLDPIPRWNWTSSSKV